MVSKMYILRERYIEGFTLWQTVFSGAMTHTDAFGVVADHYGQLLRDLFLVRPLRVPDELQKIFFEMMEEATNELDVDRKKAEAEARGDQVIIAGKKRSDTELLNIVGQF